MGLLEVARRLKAAIYSPSRNAAKKFIAWSFENFVNEDNLSKAIDNNTDILTLALNHYGMGHNRLTPLFKTVLKMYWEEVEEYITDANKIYRLISKKAGCAEILGTPRGIDYLNRCCTSSYNRLYDFLWG